MRLCLFVVMRAATVSGHTGQMQTSGEAAGHKHGCYDITANKTRRACREIV